VIRYFRAVDDAENDPNHLAAAELEPLIHTASVIYSTYPIIRGHIEGRILAGAGDAEIAEETAMPSQVINLYEALFFAVRGTVDQGNWLTRQVVAPAHWRSGSALTLTEQDAWRWAGLVGGTPLVDLLVCDATQNLSSFDPARRRLANEVRGMFRRHIGWWLEMSAADLILAGPDLFRELWPEVLQSSDGYGLAKQRAHARLHGPDLQMPAVE
jgi:hypothetical protein